MNKKFLMLLAAVLTISFAAASFAASPPSPENDAMNKPGADKWDDGKPGKPDAKVQTTSPGTPQAKGSGVADDRMSKPGADKWDEGKPGKPDAKVQTTSPGTPPATGTGVEGSGSPAKPGASETLR